MQIKWLILPAVIASVCYGLDQCTGFDEYLEKYGKTYEGDEYQKRKEAYCQNKRKVQEINSQNLGYKLSINKFSDQTDAQVRQKNGFKQIPTASQKLSSPPKDKVGQNPLSLDWRDKNAVTSVKDQGSCGSCWSFSTAAYVESRLILLGMFGTSLDLSEQYFLECTDYSTCQGGYIEYAMQSATKNQIPRESTYPYDPYNSNFGICLGFGVDSAANIVFDYYDLTDDQLIDLLQEGPVNIAVASSGWSGYSSGTFLCSSSAQIDHAVLLVGYTVDTWIIKNQWGSDWGDEGYIYVSRVSGTNCKVGHSAHVLSQYRVKLIFLAILTIIVMLY